jgi:hypothetical protein
MNSTQQRFAYVVFVGATLVAATLPAAGASDGDSHSADWKYYWDSLLPGPGGSEVPVRDFYLQSELKPLQSGHIQVWTKGLSVDDTDKATLSKEGIDRAAKKLLSGYVPPVSSIIALNHEQLAGTVGMEEIADEGVVSPQIQTLVELDCTEKLLRQISVTITSGRTFGTSDREGVWEHMPPESSGARLLTLVCKGAGQ